LTNIVNFGRQKLVPTTAFVPSTPRGGSRDSLLSAPPSDPNLGGIQPPIPWRSWQQAPKHSEASLADLHSGALFYTEPSFF